MLLALIRPSRSANLAKLDLRFRQFTSEGVVFQEAGLAKQSRTGKPRAEFFFPAFTDSVLCPRATLPIYEGRTEAFRTGGDLEQSRLFLAVIKPHRPVSSSTLARWLKALLGKAGIDTGIFKAHSVRGAAAFAAANADVMISDILTGVRSQSLQGFTTSQFGVAYLEQQCSPKVGQTNYKIPQLIWRPSLLKYNYRMAQPTEWVPAILDYMRKVRSNISTSHPILPTRYVRKGECTASTSQYGG